jgi:hypothetical protein
MMDDGHLSPKPAGQRRLPPAHLRPELRLQPRLQGGQLGPQAGHLRPQRWHGGLTTGSMVLRPLIIGPHQLLLLSAALTTCSMMDLLHPLPISLCSGSMVGPLALPRPGHQQAGGQQGQEPRHHGGGEAAPSARRLI